ncbi:DNA polymerase III subunit chi [Hylemonella gracilis str. Niagara R]|uniref:DNA polymerase III subunit chi n=1 Tax=Hylemonella gracilis str. Niagara R TaxID=1458275 RepID=A0A016XII3_9BURK|nr:DNA polymerase III subunit chi [Hylemonella gracilis]EYC51377.1 DNA polymerase III subunit chi [Hylemonella gracilis str. Niagara R]
MTTEVAFHFNAPDKLAYACRLLRKAVAQGARVVVSAPADTLAKLDVMLWTFSQTDFVAHVRLPMRPAPQASVDVALAMSPVLLADDAAAPDLPHREVLLHLGSDMPQGYADYARVIEVVSLDEQDRQQARQRWKRYTEQGHTIVRHDLQLAS